MRETRWLRIVAGVFAIALVLAACGGDDDEDSGGTTGGGTTDGGGGTAITIEGFAFSPSTLQVSGETTLTITNNDSATHTFTLDDDSVDEEIAAGESVDVTVNVSETTGFHCRFHAQMTGTLEAA
ncbi:MAG: cupredoxin domain-containing protein [Actinomycetota bacterium]